MTQFEYIADNYTRLFFFLFCNFINFLLYYSLYKWKEEEGIIKRTCIIFIQFHGSVLSLITVGIDIIHFTKLCQTEFI